MTAILPVPMDIIPVGSVPRKLPAIRLLLPFARIPVEKRLITNPRTVEPPDPPRFRPMPLLFGPASSMSSTALSPMVSVLGLAPDCVYPSMTTAAVIVGRSVAGVIVCTPDPGMLNWIRLVVFVGGGFALDALIACRNVQVAPHVEPSVSAVDVTVKVVPTGGVGVGVGVEVGVGVGVNVAVGVGVGV